MDCGGLWARASLGFGCLDASGWGKCYVHMCPVSPVCVRRPTYVDGRLRLAEKERQRRVAKEAASGGGGGTATGAAGEEEELKRAAAAADAVMAALLEAEDADKVRPAGSC